MWTDDDDGKCDDGGDGSDYSFCDLGSDCDDCGVRAGSGMGRMRGRREEASQVKSSLAKSSQVKSSQAKSSRVEGRARTRGGREEAAREPLLTYHLPPITYHVSRITYP